MILQAGHQYVFCAPYWPQDGPMDYTFNFIETSLQSCMYDINDEHDFEDKIHEAFKTSSPSSTMLASTKL
jgi:hypothetical protein